MSAKPHHLAWTIALPWAPAEPQTNKIAAQIATTDDIGVPLGGIGSGTVSRGLHGGFTRWNIKAGQTHHFEQPENCFSFWQEGLPPRALRKSAEDNAGEIWPCDPTGVNSALYPKAWHSYDSGPVMLVLEQLSPVVPELAADCDLPVGVFRAHLTNTSETPRHAAVMFSFNNLVGWFQGFNGAGHPGGVSGQHNETVDDDTLNGILMSRDTSGPLREGGGQMMIAARRANDIEISLCAAFDMRREGHALWQQFAEDGRISAIGDQWVSGGGFSEFPAPRHSAAISACTKLAPGEERVIDFCLVFDLPLISSGQGRDWHRHYCKSWGKNGESAQAIGAHALKNADDWSATIDRFHDAAGERLSLPDDAAGLAINELYFLSDGQTVWTAPQGKEPARFGLIECPDYPLYDTMDLWVYAAAAVADLFPDIAASVTREYGYWIDISDTDKRLHLRSSNRFARHLEGMVPHDLGAPNADPFKSSNDYVYQESNRWKDLNAMFVICAWRDIRKAPELASGLQPAVSQTMQALAAFDRDGDGMIENDGIPDQTFDNVPMKGISAYCGGLWLAALRAAAQISDQAADGEMAARWRGLSKTAEPVFQQALWTGAYYRVDTDGKFGDAVFAEQLYGPMTARLLGLGDVIEPEFAVRALKTVFERNFLDAGQGRGLVAVTSPHHNSALYAPKGEEGLQWDEILIGFNYSFATALRVYGLEEECRQLLGALAKELGPTRGLHFKTPAAIVPGKPLFRAQMNMRPLGIWALAEAADYLNGNSQP